MKLKAIIHQGEVAVKRMREFEELAGTDVIIIHRLLKNSLDSNEYILITDNFHQLCSEGINENGLTCEPDIRVENCEGVGEVKIVAYYPNCEELPKPVERRVSKYSGFTESMRLWRGSLWKRFTFQRRNFNNLPK